MRVSRGGGGGKGSGPHPPPGKLKNIVFLSILVRVPWKITKLPSQFSMTGHHRPASETPFKWRFASGPIMAPLLVVFVSPPPPPYQLKTFLQSSWTPSDKTFWIRACDKSLHVHSTKIQISMCIRSLITALVFHLKTNVRPLAIHIALIKDSGQTARMRRLI